jgi:plasmid stabilization system protein ParE
MAIRVLPEARDDLRDAASYYRALPPPKVGRELAARIFQDFRHALVAVADMPLSRQEHPEIPGVRWVHFGSDASVRRFSGLPVGRPVDVLLAQGAWT